MRFAQLFRVSETVTSQQNPTDELSPTVAIKLILHPDGVLARDSRRVAVFFADTLPEGLGFRFLAAYPLELGFDH
jgi:hypothetical protein